MLPFITVLFFKTVICNQGVLCWLCLSKCYLQKSSSFSGFSVLFDTVDTGCQLTLFLQCLTQKLLLSLTFIFLYLKHHSLSSAFYHFGQALSISFVSSASSPHFCSLKFLLPTSSYLLLSQPSLPLGFRAIKVTTMANFTIYELMDPMYLFSTKIYTFEPLPQLILSLSLSVLSVSSFIYIYIYPSI